jgi:hypothetical protein
MMANMCSSFDATTWNELAFANRGRQLYYSQGVHSIARKLFDATRCHANKAVIHQMNASVRAGANSLDGRTR